MKLPGLFAFILLSFYFFQNTSAQNLNQLDSLANMLLKQYNLKGLVITGIKGNEAIYKKGFGKANESHAMTSETPIYIASNTKAFVGLAMSQLIENGKLNLEDPLTKYIDRDYFPKGIEIEQVTIKDIITHTTGLSNDPMTFRTSSSGEYPKNLQELLKHTTLRSNSTELKKEFSYSNFGYLLSGIVIENITGQTWKEYVTSNVLIPLNLTNTRPYLPTGEAKSAMALPYIFNEEKPLKSVKQDNTLHAAGGLITNLDDMASWLMYQMADNKLLSDSNHNDHTYKSSLIEVEESFGPIKITGYGYGWYHGDFFGTPIIFHTGGYSGHNSFISYLPNEKVGCFIYLNETTNLRLVALQLAFYYYSLYSDNEHFLKSMDLFAKKAQSVYDNYKPDVLIPIDSKIQELPQGTYENEQYGTLTIRESNNEYIITLGENLQSIAYRSANESDFLVQFIPKSSEMFSVIKTEGNFKIKYEDYGLFDLLSTP